MASKKNKSSQSRSNRKTDSKRQKSTKSHSGSKFIYTLILAGGLLLLIVLHLDFSTVSTHAMMPNLAGGDIVVSFSPKLFSPKYSEGQIVRVNTEDHLSSPNYLRLIDLGPDEMVYGENLKIHGTSVKRLMLTNPAIVRPADEPVIWRETLANGSSYRISFDPIALSGNPYGIMTLSPNQAFLMGDNRTGSYDSRQVGPFDLDQLQGYALFILYSSRNDGLLGHWLKGLD